jgi:hypothetical protein
MINSSNWKYSYIFWFKFESLFYMLKYQSWYFVYPWYDRLYFSICLMGVGCYDGNFDDFKYIIKKPCK